MSKWGSHISRDVSKGTELLIEDAAVWLRCPCAYHLTWLLNGHLTAFGWGYWNKRHCQYKALHVQGHGSMKERDGAVLIWLSDQLCGLGPKLNICGSPLFHQTRSKSCSQRVTLPLLIPQPTFCPLCWKYWKRIQSIAQDAAHLSTLDWGFTPLHKCFCEL